MEYKYWLFERSAVEAIANIPNMQSCEFDEGLSFIQLLQHKSQDELFIDGVKYRTTTQGIIFSGKECEMTFLLVDLEKTKLNTLANNDDLLAIMQKLFRFSIRYWNKLAFPPSEKILHESNKAVVFPFSFSQRSNYRVVLERSPKDERMEKRDISMCLLAYKYGVDGTPKHEEHPQMNIYRIGGQEYLDNRSSLILSFKQDNAIDNGDRSGHPISVIEVESMSKDNSFKYLPYEQQLLSLSKSQKTIVEYSDVTSPIKVQGPAGTGKTASLVLRAISLLRKAEVNKKNWKILFFTHSRTTEEQVRSMMLHTGEHRWLNEKNSQSIVITTLQEYCAKYVHFTDSEILDKDATEAKNLQLFFIQEAYTSVYSEAYDTYKYYMSEKCRSFFDTSSVENIVNMLQHEFSIRIKGMASGLLDSYQKTPPIENGIPAESEDDIGFIYRVYNAYQNMLEIQGVYDTDDVVIEALARLNAPLWRRQRVQQGFDYLIVDEMHLFNMNEQQSFHYLTKREDQATIPICFALDYSQAIGDRGTAHKEAIGHIKYTQDYGLVFRNSRQIAELCASITASGATLFSSFLNPYLYWQTGFTAKEEEKCEVPVLYMYNHDRKMFEGVSEEIRSITSTYKVPLGEVAVIFFEESLLSEGIRFIENDYKCNYINGRQGEIDAPKDNEIVVTYPEYLNGLEYAGVILVGIDEGRVPYLGENDINQNYIRFSALNKLYLACSRAKYRVTIMGTVERGISSCLNYSLEKETLKLINKEGL